jgi:hypothetical protein
MRTAVARDGYDPDPGADERGRDRLAEAPACAGDDRGGPG